MTATTEFVVPRSIPITFPGMLNVSRFFAPQLMHRKVYSGQHKTRTLSMSVNAIAELAWFRGEWRSRGSRDLRDPSWLRRGAAAAPPHTEAHGDNGGRHWLCVGEGIA